MIGRRRVYRWWSVSGHSVMHAAVSRSNVPLCRLSTVSTISSTVPRSSHNVATNSSLASHSDYHYSLSVCLPFLLNVDRDDVDVT